MEETSANAIRQETMPVREQKGKETYYSMDKETEGEGDWDMGKVYERVDADNLTDADGWIPKRKYATSTTAYLRCKQVSSHIQTCGTDRMLLTTPEKGIDLNEIHVEDSYNKMVQRRETDEASQGQGLEDYDSIDDQEKEWLPKKIIQCGKAIGVSVDEDKDG